MSPLNHTDDIMKRDTKRMYCCHSWCVYKGSILHIVFKESHIGLQIYIDILQYHVHSG